MNKLMSRSGVIATMMSMTGSRAVVAAQAMRLYPLQSVAMRSFHAGHNHDHEDDGKESHGDFKAKAKKGPMTEEQLTAHFTELVSQNDIVLFMKGNKKMPRCGFSNYATQVLKFYGVNNWKDIDVLADEQVRDGIKKFSNWPTIPQLYVKGQFIGGCDIMKEMHADGSFEELLVRENIIKK